MLEYCETINSLELGIESYRLAAKQFYFQVLFSHYRCPMCDSHLQPSGPSLATCKCGLTLDPTVQFQKSACCNAVLIKKALHYACDRCGHIVPSKFLFDERVFNKEYFRHMMVKCRSKRRSQQEGMREIIRLRSCTLWLTEEVKLDKLEGLFDSIDRMCRNKNEPDECGKHNLNAEFDISAYWRHVISQIGQGEIMFSSIASLHGDARKDRAWLFITLIFMEHERKVDLTQYGNDILVEWV